MFESIIYFRMFEKYLRLRKTERISLLFTQRRGLYASIDIPCMKLGIHGTEEVFTQLVSRKKSSSLIPFPRTSSI